VVQEESIDEHMVEERQRNGRARAKYGFGRVKQATNRVYKTDHPFLDPRFSVGEAKASSLNAEHCGEFSLLVLKRKSWNITRCDWLSLFKTTALVRNGNCS
jgi:hypothetical protein